VVSEHNNYLAKYGFAERFLWTVLYPLADAVTILTSFDLKYFSKKNRRVMVMPNPASFELANEELRNRKKKKEILAIGQLNRYHQKGFDNLLDMAQKVIAKYPDWKFKIIGAGDHGTALLKQKAQDLGISEHIIFTGFCTNIKEILNEGEIFILPSRFEGLPMTLLEAMSQGIPCIAYNCVSGPSDIITHRENGLLIEDQNQEAMVSGLFELIENEDMRAKFRKSAPFTMDKFRIENVGKRWEDLISAVVNKEKSPLFEMPK